MSNILITVNLHKLKHVVKELKGKDGNKVKCLILPIAENHFFEGKKGIYIDLIAFKLKNIGNNRKHTHLIKQRPPKEIYEKLTKEQRYNLPVLGDAIVWERSEAETNQSEDINMDENEDEDDLPF